MMHILVICLEDFFFFFFDLLVFLGDFVAPCWLGSSKIAAEDVLNLHLLSMASSSSVGGDGSAGSRWWFSSPEWCRGACFENGGVGVDKPLGVALVVGVGDGSTNTIRAQLCTVLPDSSSAAVSWLLLHSSCIKASAPIRSFCPLELALYILVNSSRFRALGCWRWFFLQKLKQASKTNKSGCWCGAQGFTEHPVEAWRALVLEQ